MIDWMLMVPGPEVVSLKLKTIDCIQFFCGFLFLSPDSRFCVSLKMLQIGFTPDSCFFLSLKQQKTGVKAGVSERGLNHVLNPVFRVLIAISTNNSKL